MMIAMARAAAQREPAGWGSAPGDFPDGVGWPDIGLAAIRRHLSSIRLLCDQVGRPFDEVAAVYQCELRRLFDQASVVDYLPVLVSKRVRQLYQRRSQAREAGDPCATACLTVASS